MGKKRIKNSDSNIKKIKNVIDTIEYIDKSIIANGKESKDNINKNTNDIKESMPLR